MYGLRIVDKNGKSCMITENSAILAASGNLTMPNSLNVDNTYGTDIDLPVGGSGSNMYPVSSIGVLVFPTKFTFQAAIVTWPFSGGSYPCSWYADSTKNYYTKDPNSGVMTAWTPGNITAGNINTWDPKKSAFPLGSWDYPVGVNDVTKVRIWAAMCYVVYDYSAGVFRSVYSIGSAGVSEVNYAIYVKKN